MVRAVALPPFDGSPCEASKRFEYYAALIRIEESTVLPTKGPLLNYVHRVPLGVCALITSFNHPLLITVKKLAPALAAGNSVVVKPSELAPLSVLQLGEIAQEAGRGIALILVKRKTRS